MAILRVIVQVKDFHTYFVSNLSIWTHNSCNINGSQLSGFAKKSKPNDGLPGGKVSLDTVYDGAKYFVGPNYTTLNKKGYKWFYSADGKKRVRVMNKQGKGIPEANFETFNEPWKWEKEGNRLTNYHVEVE